MPKNTEAERAADIALRKKKNADAQAAFRARRANYIATLEETVTSLESVVLQLQDSCREARSEAQELRQQNAGLRHEYREREKFWRALWQRKSGGENDELPPLPQPILNGNIGSSQLYSSEHMAYGSHDDRAICNGPYNAAGSYTHSPSLSYAADASDSSPHALAHRAKYGSYSYGHRDHAWSQSAESGPSPSTHSNNSPSFTESPSLNSSELSVTSFSTRYSEDHKVPVSSLDSAPYVFPGSRSMSPTSTAPSSSASMTTPFQFTFPDGGERTEFEYRRNSNPRPDLHAEVSLSGPGSDAVRYRLGSRRADSSAGDRPMSILPPLAISDSGSPHSDGDSISHSRRRRGSVLAAHSRSTSPSGAPPLSGTLAVIKAQAFGALRRTRARTKKTADGPAKTAFDVLEARGIEMGVPSSSKRQRTEESDES